MRTLLAIGLLLCFGIRVSEAAGPYDNLLSQVPAEANLLVLIDAERTLSETRASVVDAFATYHDARARLARLTAAAPSLGDTQ